jgi:hypothetical protein
MEIGTVTGRYAGPAAVNARWRSCGYMSKTTDDRRAVLEDAALLAILENTIGKTDGPVLEPARRALGRSSTRQR